MTEKLKKDERNEIVTDIAETFVKCDPYHKGFLAGVIETLKSMQGGDQDANASSPSAQV